MKRHRHTPEQVVRKLREGERLLNDGKDLTEVLRTMEISEATWNRWRSQYGGMKASEAKRLKELESENVRLKKLVANQALDIDMLKELAEGNFSPRTAAAGPWGTCGKGSGSPSVGLVGLSARTGPPTGCPDGAARTRSPGCAPNCAGLPASTRGGGGGWRTGSCAAIPPRRGRA